jgi:hypothetical protein
MLRQRGWDRPHIEVVPRVGAHSTTVDIEVRQHGPPLQVVEEWVWQHRSGEGSHPGEAGLGNVYFMIGGAKTV